MYSQQVLDHFQNPRCAGELAEASATVELSNPACGDVLRLAMRVEDGRAAEVRFRAKGCVAAIACGSRVAEMMQGCALHELRKLQREELIESLGGLPPASQHAAALAMDALRTLLREAPVR